MISTRYWFTFTDSGLAGRSLDIEDARNIATAETECQEGMAPRPTTPVVFHRRAHMGSLVELEPALWRRKAFVVLEGPIEGFGEDLVLVAPLKRWSQSVTWRIRRERAAIGPDCIK